MMSTAPTTTHLGPTLARAVQAAAANAGQSVSAFIVECLYRAYPGLRPVEEQKHEPIRTGFTYLIRCGAFYKIGRARDVAARLRGMTLPECELIGSARDAGLEQVLHRKFSDRRVRGEWFLLTAEDVEEVKRVFEAG